MKLADGWQLKTISEIGKVVTGSTPSTSDPNLYGGDIPFVTPGDLGGRRDIATSERTLSEKGVANARVVPAGTTLVTCIGSTIGKSGLAATTLATNQQINAVIPDSSYDPVFVYYQIQAVAETFRLLAGTQAVPLLNKSAFSSVEIAVPSSKLEQQSIAAILSTWDQAIATTERLLLNTTTLLDLVAARTFESAKDASDQLPFREVFDVENHKAAQVPRESYLSVGALPIIDQGKELIGGYTDADDVSVAPSVVVFGDHTRIIKWADFRFRPGADGTQILRPKASVHPRFAFHAVVRVRLPNLGYSRHMSFLRDSSLQIPRSVDRQREIAQRLDVIVRQRELLASQVDALQREKASLVSQLLTGKRRVKLPDVEVKAQA